jgi:hypothetical protein
MKRMDWIGLGPSFVLAIGMVAATWVAAHAPGNGERALGAVAVLAVGVVWADVWNRRLRGRSARPSWAAMFLLAGLAGASAILMNGDAGYLRTMIPVFGIGCWVSLLMRPEAKGMRCQVVAKDGGRG